MNRTELHELAEKNKHVLVQDILESGAMYDTSLDFLSDLYYAHPYPKPNGWFIKKCPLCNRRIKPLIVSRNEYWNYKFYHCTKLCGYIYVEDYQTLVNKIDMAIMSEVGII